MSEHMPFKLKPNKWWYIGGGIALVVGVYAYRKQTAKATAAAAIVDPNADPSAVDTSGFGTSGFSPVQGTTPSLYGFTDPSTGAFIAGITQSSPSVVTAPSTNGQWAQQAEAYLVSLNYSSIEVAAALGKYLFGGGLTDTQMQIVQAAIAFEGTPPQPVPAPHVNPPVGQPKPPAPGVTKYRTVKGDTLAKVSAKFYGSARLNFGITTLRRANPVFRLFGANTRMPVNWVMDIPKV